VVLDLREKERRENQDSMVHIAVLMLATFLIYQSLERKTRYFVYRWMNGKNSQSIVTILAMQLVA